MVCVMCSGVAWQESTASFAMQIFRLYVVMQSIYTYTIHTYTAHSENRAKLAPRRSLLTSGIFRRNCDIYSQKLEWVNNESENEAMGWGRGIADTQKYRELTSKIENMV